MVQRKEEMRAAYQGPPCFASELAAWRIGGRRGACAPVWRRKSAHWAIRRSIRRRRGVDTPESRTPRVLEAGPLLFND
jgi:hypothetical protein